MTTSWDFHGDLRIKRNYRVNIARDLKNSSNMTAHKKQQGHKNRNIDQWKEKGEKGRR